MGSNALDITHAELAQLIGARRERVNQIVGTLRASGMVDLGRGRLTQLDRPGLLRQACGCFSGAAEVTRTTQATGRRRAGRCQRTSRRAFTLKGLAGSGD